MMRTLLFNCCLVLLFCCYSCKKEKQDHQMSHLQQADSMALSPVRLINTAEFQQVTVNGNNLTSFKRPRTFSPFTDPYILPHSGYWSKGYPGTKYFPIDGYLGREWRIPKGLFRENGRLDLFLQSYVGYPNNSGGPMENLKMGTTIIKTDNKAQDYYIGYHPNYGEYVVIDRDESPSRKPGFFKIRILNMSTNEGVGGSNPAGNSKDLAGPVTLTYADGTPVDSRTSNVPVTGRASAYVELPYGKYQFHVLSSTGLQIPGTDGWPAEMILDPPTSSIERDFMNPSHLIYAPIHSYKPGETYTILIYPSLFELFLTNNPYKVPDIFLQNAFRIIEDTEPSINHTYCRAQGFNALPAEEVRLRLNGKEMDSGIAYGNASAYQIMSTGSCKIELLNPKAEVTASLDYDFNADQNYTIWIYPAANGKPLLKVVVNDLTGEKNNYPFYQRFLNLCPDIPYLTFTRNNGQSLGGAEATNLQPGMPVLNAPYVKGAFNQEPYEIMAYHSAPGLVPGLWLDQIPVLKSKDFIASEALYSNAGTALPVHEPGYYTVAVIGRTGPDVPAAHQARMIILKHNK
jgi:hypothetical protein